MKDKRVEFILCRYSKGDHGDYHWHPDVDEYEIVIEGKIGYKDALTGETVWFEKGDFSYIPAGLCVRRIVVEKSITVAIKVPSKDDKVTCNVCPYREECPIGSEDDV